MKKNPPKIKASSFPPPREFKPYASLRIGAASSALFLFASCQTFESRPLNLATHDQKWRAQNPSSEKVHDFAKRLNEAARSSSSFNPSDGLSLNEGKMIALVYNPDLRVARLKAGVAKATADHAGVWDDPELSLDVLKITKGVPDPWIVGSSLSLTLPLSGRLQAEKGRAKAAKYAELDRVAETEWKVTTDLQKAWISWSAQHSQLEQTEKIVEALGSIVKSTQVLVKQGEIPKTEAALFLIEETSHRAELARLKGEMEAEEQEIRTLLGISPNAPIQLVPTLTMPTWQPSEERLANHNPTLNRLRREYEVSEHTLLREIRKQYPDLTIGPQAESDQGQSRIGFIGAIPLPIWNANKGGIAAALTEREVAQAAFETEYERKVGQLAVLRARLSAMRSQRSSIEKNLIPMVDRQVADAEKLVQLGEGGSLVLLESLVRAHEAKLKIITIQLQYSQAEIDIQSLLGPTNFKSNSKKD